MEINKQLFEDVLSGKLKGKFVFKNVHNIYGVALKPNHTCIQKALTDGFYIIRMPSLLFNVVNTEGKSVYGCTNHKGYSENDSNYDIIDFIPDTNMKENELTIEIPNGKIVDWEESKRQNKIVLKDKEQLLAYEEICDKLDGMIDIPLFDTPSEDGNALVANEHQLECLLAKNKLANVAITDGNPKKGKKMDGLFSIMSVFTDLYLRRLRSIVMIAMYFSNPKNLHNKQLKFLEKKLLCAQ